MPLPSLPKLLARSLPAAQGVHSDGAGAGPPSGPAGPARSTLSSPGKRLGVDNVSSPFSVFLREGRYFGHRPRYTDPSCFSLLLRPPGGDLDLVPRPQLTFTFLPSELLSSSSLRSERPLSRRHTSLPPPKTAAEVALGRGETQCSCPRGCFSSARSPGNTRSVLRPRTCGAHSGAVEGARLSSQQVYAASAL